jgi:Flp pilus assembly protein TadG
MRTSGVGHEKFMLLVPLVVALVAGTALAGGPMQFLRVVNDVIDAVATTAMQWLSTFGS